MSRTLVQTENPNFVRDTSSMALINKNYSAKEEYYSKLKIITSQKEEINTIKSNISSMKNDMTEIKELLAQLLGKGTNG